MTTAPMVVAAARTLCKRSSEACNVNNDDNWKVYGQDFIEDAQAALDACGASELLEALLTTAAMLSACRLIVSDKECRDEMGTQVKAAQALLAKATGEQS
jgi:hypothetical protein